jgi:Protein of unknown function (DUF1461)
MHASASLRSRIIGRTVSVSVIAAFVPLVLIGNAVHVIAHPWFAHAELGRLRPDPYGMTRAEQNRLADVSLDSIVPIGGGDRALAQARLANGAPAFDEKERHHLSSVRGYVAGLFAINLAGLLAIAAGLAFRQTRQLTKDGLAAGALLTLGIATFCGFYSIVAPVSFLGGFHRVFFSGDSWRFDDDETLRRLFPDAFWSDTAIVLGVLVAVQAGAILMWRRQAIRSWARTPAHARS